jgi:lipoprotein-releasing system permease protein
VAYLEYICLKNRGYIVFHPITFFIGLRYIQAKQRNYFVSFMSFSSMIGIALGVMVLITVLSVMNGFDYEIRHRVLGMAKQITISSYTGRLADWQSLQQHVKIMPDVLASAPFIASQGLLTNQNVVQPVAIFGIDPAAETAVSILPQKIIAGRLNALAPKTFGIVLGQKLANQLGVQIGDPVNLVTTTPTITPIEIMPRFKRFTVVGIFKIGNGFEYDSSVAYIDLHDAQILFQMGEGVSGVQLKIANTYDAPALAKKISAALHNHYLISNWTQDFGAFFSAIKMEKSMMFLMLLLIIAVAAFNLVSSLVMVVQDKRSDIAILRTLGATPRTILTIFIIQGSAIGLVGTLLGLIFGLLLASHVTALVDWIQHIFHVQLIASDVYYVDYLPSRIEWPDIGKITCVALAMSLLATLYPAWDAARTQPARALRYE